MTTGLNDPLLAHLLQDICDQVGADADALPPLYRKLALAALEQAETLVLTYVTSHLNNTPLRRKGGRANLGKGVHTHG